MNLEDFQNSVEGEKALRGDRAKKLQRFIDKIKAEVVMGGKEEKIKFLKSLNTEGFKKWLIRINAVLRDVPGVKHNLDGQTALIADAGGNIAHLPPHAEDKEELLGELLSKLQSMEDLEDMGYMSGAVLNAIHPFGDANGRVSRLVLFLLKDDYQGTAEQKRYLQEIIGAEGRKTVDPSSETFDQYLPMFEKQKLDTKNTSFPKPDKHSLLLQEDPNDEDSWIDTIQPQHLKIVLSESVNARLSVNEKQELCNILNLDNSRGWGFVNLYTLLSEGSIDNPAQYIKEIPSRKEKYIDTEELLKACSIEDIRKILETNRRFSKEQVEKIMDTFTYPQNYEINFRSEQETIITTNLKELYKQRAQK